MPIKPKLNNDEILKAEYNYIANTVFQANEDRSRVASFYFVSVGSLVAAILSSLFSVDNLKNIALAFSGLFFVLTILGALTLAQLARLRAAWHESVQAMNQIKDFYIEHNKEIEPAFKWRLKTLPSTDKPFSIANLMAVEVSLLGAITSAASIYFLLLTLGDIKWWSWIILIAALYAAYRIQWAWYKYLLVDNQ
jgi:Na+/melibiose symporter-like transporter